MASLLGLLLAGMAVLAIIVTMDSNRTALLAFTTGATTTWVNLGLLMFSLIGLIGIGAGIVVAAVSLAKGR